MFRIRRAKLEDLDTLLKLARMVHFINLPADREIISEKILWSRECFRAAANDAEPSRSRVPSSSGIAASSHSAPLFMFVLEDLESQAVLGTSQVVSRMGGPGMPNVSFQLSRREKFSQSLQSGTTHTVMKLRLDESGPSEIGGLILQPSYRRHRARLGKLLSFVRFHFVGLHRGCFSDLMLAEMMGVISHDGRSTFWESFGRRFINLPYEEADRFCQTTKEFMFALLPSEEIYLTLLPAEARSVIAEVGEETVPARKMLEQLEFRYLDRIDPFDAGPNLEAPTDRIPLVRDTRAMPVRVADDAHPDASAIVSSLTSDGEFHAVQANVSLSDGVVTICAREAEHIGVSAGDTVGVTPVGTPNETA